MDGPIQDHAPAKPGPTGEVGPNAVIQLGHAVEARLGRAAASCLFRAADLSDLLATPPQRMIDQAIPTRLFGALWSLFPDEAADMAQDAGRRTADYIIANRIPRIAKLVFAIAPRRVRTRLLIHAIARNAWTFVGSGGFEAKAAQAIMLEIADNPMTMPGCAWHAAVFQRLFERLVAPGTEVRLVSGDAPGERHRFHVTHPNPRAQGIASGHGLATLALRLR